VVSGSRRAYVILNNGAKYEAKIIGVDQKTDIALLKIDVDFPLHPAKLGNSDDVLIGSWVMAVGAPFGLTNSVSIGVVSGIKRNIGWTFYDNYIQTDASINPGSSGGPLFNLAGEVIGINTLIFTDRQEEGKAYNIGIAFAIPINMAKDVIERLKRDGKIVRSSFGIIIQRITSELQKELGLKNRDGVLVSSIGKKSPAEKGGLQRGDVIIEINGKKMTSIVELSFTVSMIYPGSKVRVIIIRNGKRKKLVIKVTEMMSPEKALEIVARIEKNFGFTAGPITPQVIDDLSLEDKVGVVILEVEEKSPAAWAGIKNNDIIISINRKKVKNMDDYREIIRKQGSKKQILLVIKREGVTSYRVVKKK
jgi:serine protease Do